MERIARSYRDAESLAGGQIAPSDGIRKTKLHVTKKFAYYSALGSCPTTISPHFFPRLFIPLPSGFEGFRSKVSGKRANDPRDRYHYPAHRVRIVVHVSIKMFSCSLFIEPARGENSLRFMKYTSAHNNYHWPLAANNSLFAFLLSERV